MTYVSMNARDRLVYDQTCTSNSTTFVPQNVPEIDCKAQRSAGVQYVHQTLHTYGRRSLSLIIQIDVHYSLPRDDHSKGGDKEKNQVGATESSPVHRPSHSVNCLATSRNSLSYIEELSHQSSDQRRRGAP